MIHCPQTDLIQDYLDDELVPAERLAFESHLGSCRACAAELAMYQGVFGRLDAIETFDPGPEFTERVLAQVMPPAKVAWSKGLGLAYVSALGASVALAAAAFVFPAPRAWATSLFVHAARALVSSFLFVLKSINEALVHVADAALAAGGLLARVAPVLRALAGPLSQPAVVLSLVAALAVSAAVLWWMRPRETRAERGMSDVGLLGL
jgi:anti-sigma factor RsiW